VADQIPDSAKLLPCPFCGSPDVSMSFSATLQSPEPAHRFAECDDCGSCGAGVKIARGDDDGAKALAIGCWNARAASLSQSVVSLVIAAREAFDTGTLPDDEQTALDQALECFASAVPYENEPATPASHASDGGKA